MKNLNMLYSTKHNALLDLTLASYAVKLVFQNEVQCYTSFYHELDYEVLEVEKSLITQVTFKY